MTQSKLPGLIANHHIITPQCRHNRGSMGAFDLVAARMREIYTALVGAPENDGVDWHVVLVREERTRLRTVMINGEPVEVNSHEPYHRLVELAGEQGMPSMIYHAKIFTTDGEKVEINRIISPGQTVPMHAGAVITCVHTGNA